VKTNTPAKRQIATIADLHVSILDSDHDIVGHQPPQQAETVKDRDLLRTVIDNLPGAIYVKDAAARRVLANPADLRNLGCKTEAEVLGKNDFDFFPKDIAEKFWAADQKVLQGQPVINQEEEVLDEKGKKRWLLTSKLPLRDPNGKITGLVGIGQEITEYKLAEEALANERALLRTLVDNLPVAFYVKDLAGRKTLVNRVELDFVGATSEAEILGKTDFDLFPPEKATVYRANDQEIIRTGQSIINREGSLTKPDGSVIYTVGSIVPVRDAAGRMSGLAGITLDITDRKLAEAKLEAAHKQLLEVSRQTGMAEVATSVLHNVGNVLNSVNVASSCVAESLKKSKTASLSKVVALLRENEADLGNFFTNDPKGKQLPGYLSHLAEHLAGEQAAALDELALLQKNIEHIKEIVAMQQNYATSASVPEQVLVVDLVEDAFRMNTGAMERHHVKVVREYSETPQISIEKHKVLQILVNLIRNAKYACDDSGRQGKQIILRVANGNESIKISVIDNGVGIPAENMTRIFNHGFTTRENGHGFGLHSGALAAKEIGGNLIAFSEGPGRGATFTLELPVQKKGRL
jgi:PAS domain S-box-containing protein